MLSIDVPRQSAAVESFSPTVSSQQRRPHQATRAPEFQLLQVDRFTGESNQEYSLVQLCRLTDPPRPAPIAGGRQTDTPELDTSGPETPEPERRYRLLVNSLPGFSVISLDREMRVMSAAGEALEKAGYVPSSMTGKFFGDAFPMLAFNLVRADIEASLAGEESESDYVSPVSGLEYRIRFRPIRSNDGTIVGSLVVSAEVTADRTRRGLIDQVQWLGHAGSCSYDLINGWRADAQLFALLGVDTVEQVVGAIDTLIVPEDRDVVRAAFREAGETGRQTTVRYRIVQGRTGAVRHIRGAFRAVTDTHGHLLRAMITHADVSAAVAADELRLTHALSRTELLRKVSDTMEGTSGSVTNMMQEIVDVASSAIGDCVVVRILTPDRTDVECDLTSVQNREDVSRMSESLIQAVRDWDPTTAPAPAIPLVPAPGSGSAGDSVQPVAAGISLDGRSAHPDAAHLISVPIRHAGQVMGFVRAFRLSESNPYKNADADLLQVISDRIGSALAESRVRQLLEFHYSMGRVVAAELHKLTLEQRVLLEELAGVEERERMLLAEAIHDEPLQLIVAVMMRMDSIGMGADPLEPGEMDELVGILETSVAKLRTLIIALTPPDLAQGLGVALEKLALGVFVGKTTRIAVHCIPHVHLTPLRKGNAYRILREALVNVRKHANAGLIELSLEEADGWVVARVRDDGVGTGTLHGRPGHLGMPTMHARAAAEDGSLDVTSEPGRGTTVTLRLPVNAEGETHRVGIGSP